MNKRIQKLESDALLFALKYRQALYRDERTKFDMEILFREKFAELIVRECAEVAGETRWAVPPTQEQIARSIKQHFGVEE